MNHHEMHALEVIYALFYLLRLAGKTRFYLHLQISREHEMEFSKILEKIEKSVDNFQGMHFVMVHFTAKMDPSA